MTAQPMRLLLLLTLALTACVKPRALPVQELVRQDDVYLHPETLEPYTGPVFATFEGSPLTIRQRAVLRDGQYDGPFEAYYENGHLIEKEVYQGGKKDGPYEWFFESGRLFERGTYEDGTLHGPYEAYYENGELVEKGTYKNGNFDGPREWYFVNGRLVELVTYRDGEITGPYARYTREGHVTMRGVLEAGRPCGEWLQSGQSVAYPDCEDAG